LLELHPGLERPVARFAAVPVASRASRPPLLGFIGAALLVAGDIAVLFGLIGQHAPSTALAAIPIALWEFSLGVWLVVRGFKPSSVLFSDARDAGVDRPVERAAAA